MLTGDSMNRNQFESLLCMLREGLPDKSKMYEVHGYKITKGRGYYIFKFEVIAIFFSHLFLENQDGFAICEYDFFITSCDDLLAVDNCSSLSYPCFCDM